MQRINHISHTNPTLALLAAVAIGGGLSLCTLGCDGSKSPVAAEEHDHDGHDHEGHDHEGHDHGKGEAPAEPKPVGASTEPKAADAHDEHAGHDHAAADAKDDHGPVTQLGEQTVGGYIIKASRDGALTAGGEAPIDVWVSGGAKVSAVRFWIGTEDAKGSVKAKAAIEHENWHTHAEVPKPLATDAKLWVEIEAEGGAKVTASFDLKA